MKCRFIYLVLCLCAVWLMGCSSHGGHGASTHLADELNCKAYTWRYRNLDSTEYYAKSAYQEAERYKHGRTMACNMLGFVAFMRMNYDEALFWYEEVDRLSGCELERLVADVGRMYVYLRTADNLAFYNSRVKAMKRLAHIEEESELFAPAERARLQSTVNDLYMISALHHYMIGQRPEAYAEMDKIQDDEVLRVDSAQWLMAQYMRGSGFDIEGDTREQRLLRRYTHLNNCLRESREGGYVYFSGLALSGLSELLADSARNAYLAQLRPNSLAQLTEGMEEAVFALVSEAQECLHSYGDRYGEVNAKVQTASLYNRIGEYGMALDTLLCMLEDSTLVPDVLCRLHEEASLAYSGLGDKASSDHHRNLYLDLLEMTRQDKELENRYWELMRQQRRMNLLLCAVLGGITLFVLLVALMSRYRRRKGNGYEQHLRDLLQDTEKRVYLQQRHIEAGKRGNVVRKATFSMVTGMMPYIDRMVREIDRLQNDTVWSDAELRARKQEYIGELASEINNLNEVLSQWIKTTQGVVSLHIESFSLSEVFDMIARSNTSFALKGLTLDVLPTDAVVKADKALTFFMLNTLADNARKFTPEGGRVSIAADVCEDYVELSVSDTGVGMSTEDISHIMGEKVYDAASIGQDLLSVQRKNKGSGFGLLNCKGIIDKYRKTDPFFEVCRMGIDSRVGEGSRFWFRLPKGVRRLMTFLCLITFSSGMYANSFSSSDEGVGESYSPLLMKASAYADSVYYANVDGRYEAALSFADSALYYLNIHHRRYADHYIAPLTATRGEENDVEMRWWLSDFATDYHTILDVRNEMAVANLALRRWEHYRYNNRIYNDLYKLISEDRSLVDYCNRMQRYNSNISVAVLFCVLLVFGYLAVLIYTFMGRVEHVYRDIESVEDEERRARHEGNRLHVQNMVLDNCLSIIKHETVYYPNRIKQLVSRLDGKDERQQMKELVDYYRVVFTTLANCASRQLDEVTFRRSEVQVATLLHRAQSYHAKAMRQHSDAPALSIDNCGDLSVHCDADLVAFLLEQLIDVALFASPADSLTLKTSADGDFVRFSLINTSRTLAPEALQSLFSPSYMSSADGSRLQGTEYIVCRQIIREHDSYFNHIGCRIKADSTPNGYVVWFTLPSLSPLK